ncbi:MAG: hypothetical protein ACKOEI_13175 [Chthoniobacterales bacterium]
MKRVLLATTALLGVAIAAIAFALRTPPEALVEYAASPDFNRMLSQSVSHALKVDGQFGPMSLRPDWSVVTDNFTSKGWPGQAIGALDAGKTTGRFNPWGILRGQWLVPNIALEKLDLRLATPDDALKAQDPVLPPKPWYAFLMPSQFHCGWIDCPDASIDLPFGSEVVRAEGQHVGATMIGANFKYYGKSGRLLSPDYPALDVDSFEVYVTREMIDIGYLYLREPLSPHSNLQLAVRLGQHADKSIKASAQINALDIVPFLPAEVAKVLSGKLSGALDYATDSSGKNINGGGTVSLAGGELKNWTYLDDLARRSGHPAFRQLKIDDVTVSYDLSDEVIRVDNLAARAGGSISLSGRGSWNTQTSAATLSLDVAGVPLGAYLPPSIAGSLQGAIGGTVEWSWSGTDLAEGSGGGTLQLQDTKLSGFSFQKFLDRFFKSRDYAEMEVTQADCRWRQDHTGLYLENVNILAPGQAGLRGSLSIAPDGTLSGTILAGLPESALHWLPDATKTVFARSEDGLYWCSIKVWGTEKKPETDFTAQVLRQLEKHPVALAELAARGVSWWLGDVLHTKAAEEEG